MIILVIENKKLRLETKKYTRKEILNKGGKMGSGQANQLCLCLCLAF